MGGVGGSSHQRTILIIIGGVKEVRGYVGLVIRVSIYSPGLNKLRINKYFRCVNVFHLSEYRDRSVEVVRGCNP